MRKPFKQSFPKTSLSFPALLIIALAFSFTLSGCGGGGGGSSSAMMPGEGGQQMPDGGQQMPDGSQQMPDGGQEPMRQRVLDAIEDIQNRARSNNSDDDVVADILLTATHRPHGHTFTTGGTTISSTTQYSFAIDGVSRERMLAIAEYGADGMLDVSVGVQHTSTVVTGLYTTAPEALVSRIKDIPEAGWKGVEFRDESDVHGIMVCGCLLRY